jgi:hypothetical protein
MKRLWKDYNLGIVLGLLFLLSWIGQLIVQWFNWAHEQDGPRPAAAGRIVPVAVLGEHVGELAVGVPAAVLLRGAVRVLHPPGQRRVQGQRRADAAVPGRIEKRLQALEEGDRSKAKAR